MRSAFAYVALLLYLAVLLRPVTPWISYAMQRDYFAKELCVNKSQPRSCCAGKCAVNKMVETNTSERSDAPAPKVEITELTCTTAPETGVPEVIDIPACTEQNGHYSFAAILCSLDILSPPPQA